MDLFYLLEGCVCGGWGGDKPKIKESNHKDKKMEVVSFFLTTIYIYTMNGNRWLDLSSQNTLKPDQDQLIL